MLGDNKKEIGREIWRRSLDHATLVDGFVYGYAQAQIKAPVLDEVYFHGHRFYHDEVLAILTSPLRYLALESLKNGAALNDCLPEYLHSRRVRESTFYYISSL